MGRSSRLDRWVSGRGRAVLIGIAVLAMLAVPLANVFASDAFTDVPDSSPYHDAISAIANAGITGGCNSTGTKYCPTGLVTRQQMAVFLNRLGNLSNEHGPVTDALSVVGQTTIYASETFTLAGSLATECLQSENALPLASELPYLVTAQLTDAPGSVLSSTVNVSVDDPNLEDEVFDVCFTGIGSTTTAGAHKVVLSLSLDFGSGIFASASVAPRSDVLEVVKRWKD